MFGRKLKNIKRTLEIEEAYARRNAESFKEHKNLVKQYGYQLGRAEAYAQLLRIFFK